MTNTFTCWSGGHQLEKSNGVCLCAAAAAVFLCWFGESGPYSKIWKHAHGSVRQLSHIGKPPLFFGGLFTRNRLHVAAVC